MRWWLRFVSTLVLGPVVWWIVVGYAATQQGSTLAQWIQQTPAVLPKACLFYTGPALLLCAILFGVDSLLTALSLDLFTVATSPLIALGLAWAAVRFVPEPHVHAAGASLPLFACYGIVWGLTIREPRRVPRNREGGEFVGAPLL